MALVTNIIKGSEAQRLLLLVHGYGADERDLGGLLPYLDPDGIFAAVLPRGPVAAPGTPGRRARDEPGGTDCGGRRAGPRRARARAARHPRPADPGPAVTRSRPH